MKILRVITIAFILSALLAACIPATSAQSEGFTVNRVIQGDTFYPGKTYDVTISFTVPCDGFLPGFTDAAPSGWQVSTNTAWCAPASTFSNVPAPGTVEYIWFSRYKAGTEFCITYRFTVPAGAASGSYCFPGGTIEYYANKAGPYIANITGENVVAVSAPQPPSGGSGSGGGGGFISGGAGSGSSGTGGIELPSPSPLPSPEPVFIPPASSASSAAAAAIEENPAVVETNAASLIAPPPSLTPVIVKPAADFAPITVTSPPVETHDSPFGLETMAWYWWIIAAIWVIIIFAIALLAWGLRKN